MLLPKCFQKVALQNGYFGFVSSWKNKIITQSIIKCSAIIYTY